MVHLNEILEGLVRACKEANDLPPDVTYATVELDSSGEHSDVTPPVIEFSVDDIVRDRSRNTEMVGYEYNDDGHQDGYRFTQWFDATVTAEIISVAQTQYNHRELDRLLRQTLTRFDKHSPLTQQLPDPEDPNETLNDVGSIVVENSEPSHDFDMSPSVRTRQVGLVIDFVHEFKTSELGIEYNSLEEVEVPTDWVSTTDSGGIELE